MTWQPGADRIRSLLDTGELERVTPDAAVARRLLMDAGKHLTTTASAIADTADTDLAGGYQLAYDALRKSAAALLLQPRVGQRFDGFVTGASDKGTWVRVLHPPVEGRVVQGFQGAKVGATLRVELASVDVERGYIDFKRAPA